MSKFLVDKKAKAGGFTKEMSRLSKEDAALFSALTADFPAEALKELNFGRKMTTIDAYYIVERLTHLFGLYGSGWGLCGNNISTMPDVQVTGNSVAVIGNLWYRNGETISYAFAVGDGTVTKGNIAEGIKKATTNLISKASSYIGVGFSIYHGGHFDDPYLDKKDSD